MPNTVSGPMKLSIVMPVYNEVATIDEIVRRVLDAPIPVERELVVVDDCSTDGTRDKVKTLAASMPDRIRLIEHAVNRGKGAAVRTGFREATGDLIIIQDADLEYNPCDIPAVISPILDGRADVVFGSRFLGAPHRVLFFWHYMGNRFLTFVTNLMYNVNLTDMETCYKAFTKKALSSFELKANRFGIEPEMTAKFCKRKFRIFEVAVSYNGRGYEEGKKITWKDGFVALWLLLKHRFVG
ncbi:MAG: glycosyltransferase family 2 protein [Planctomycetota bacterium]|nr:glycosyltransferase family 2 protein [Planctomycetota bacterium]